MPEVCCQGFGRAEPYLSRIHSILNNLTSDLVDARWPFSVVEFSHFLSFPRTPCKAHEYMDEFSAFLICYLDCNFEKYHMVRQSECPTTIPDDVRNCFDVGVALRYQHTQAAKVMKYSMQPPTLIQTEAEYLNDFKDLRSFQSPESALGTGARLDIEYERLATKTFNPRVYACNLGGVKARMQDMVASNCRLFHRTYSNYGIAFTFNGAPIEETFVETTIFKLISSIFWMKSTKAGSHENIQWVSPQSNVIQLILQLSDAQPLAAELATERGILDYAFRLSLHDPLSPPDLRYDYIRLQPKKHHVIFLEPSVTTAKESTRSMPLETRGCKFADTEDGCLSAFKSYSKAACTLECSLKVAYSTCGCLPWNYLHFEVGTRNVSELCDMEGNFCVEDVLANGNHEES